MAKNFREIINEELKNQKALVEAFPEKEFGLNMIDQKTRLTTKGKIAALEWVIKIFDLNPSTAEENIKAVKKILEVFEEKQARCVHKSRNLGKICPLCSRNALFALDEVRITLDK